MNFMDYDLGRLNAGAVVEVTLDSRAFVRLLDEPNFQSYRSGGRYQFLGGEALRSPVPLEAPHSGHWHVVVDFNGGPGQVRSSVNVLSAA
jgi:hypothetical protein